MNMHMRCLFKNIAIIILFFFAGIKTGWTEGKDASQYELEKIIVSATKTETYQAEIGSSATVITGKDIGKAGKNSVEQVLRSVPGVSVTQNGPFGGSASVFLRGAKPGHTLVLIDGIEVNDPMAADRSFNFAHLSTDNIERIEVIRGPQSNLYGSDAMAGVINIITKKGKGRPKWEVSSESGTHNTFRENVNLSGGTKRINYSLSASRLDSEGISKARDTSERDSYENNSFSTKTGYRILDGSELTLVTHFIDTRTGLDYAAYVDDPNYTAWWRDFAARISFDQVINHHWDHNLSFFYNDVRRKDRNEKDDLNTTTDTQSWFKGDNKKIEWQNNFYPFSWDTLICGFEYEEERGSSYYRSGASITKFDRKTLDNEGYYLQNQFKLGKNLFITPGLRIDDYELFGAETTYKLSAAYNLIKTGTRLKANWGTGFKAPSLYQLYSSYGNPNLSPDKSRGYDFGFEQSFFDDKAFLGLTYFHNKFENMVDFDLDATSPTYYKYINIGKAKTKGFEAEASFKPMADLKVALNYTHTVTKDEETGRKLLRRPENQIGIGINWAFLEKASINLDAEYVGHNWDNSTNTEKVKPYTKVDLFTSYDLADNFQIFAKISNLLDRKYAEVRGYATPGRSFYAGSKIKF